MTHRRHLVVLVVGVPIVGLAGCGDVGWETGLRVPTTVSPNVDLTSARYDFDFFREGEVLTGGYKHVQLGGAGVLELFIGEFPVPSVVEPPRPDRVTLTIIHVECEEVFDLSLNEETAREVRNESTILTLELNEPVVIDGCQ